ncbi:MAG: hypothetical protein PHG19_09590 [Anaerotignum sp.]|nr:hypothetical protein [Anaerotignum sp.]
MPFVSIYDTRITAHRGDRKHSFDHEDNALWSDFIETMRFMGSIGFYVGEDKHIKKRYPIDSKNHREGRYAHLEFKAEWHPNLFEIAFFQNVQYENLNGGYWDFEKRSKMPYLIGKTYEVVYKKLIRFFEGKGYDIKFLVNQKRGKDFIIEDYIRSCHHPQKERFDLSEIEGETVESYNNQDRDRNTVYNGETKYFRDWWNGYLMRGKVYHNINNMWWVLLPCGGIRNIASFQLFNLSDTDKWGRLKTHNPPAEYVERRKQLSFYSEKELKNELRRREKKKGISHKE